MGKARPSFYCSLGPSIHSSLSFYLVSKNPVCRPSFFSGLFGQTSCHKVPRLGSIFSGSFLLSMFLFSELDLSDLQRSRSLEDRPYFVKTRSPSSNQSLIQNSIHKALGYCHRICLRIKTVHRSSDPHLSYSDYVDEMPGMVPESEEQGSRNRTWKQ